jgi:hypothetical protein
MLPGNSSLDDQSVKSGRLGNLWLRGVLEVLLLPLASQGVTMTEDEVNLVGGSTLVRTEHDGEWSLIVLAIPVLPCYKAGKAPCRCIPLPL